MSDIHSQIIDPEKVLKLAREFFDQYHITSADVIHENARVIEAADTFIEALGPHVGWAEEEADEDDDITSFDYDEDNPHLETEY